MDTLLERLQAALAPRGIVVDRELASGGMGTVFAAQEPSLERALAIKILRPELCSAHAIERFQREARLLANLTHPHIVPVHATGFADGIPYYTMDLLTGETLADRLQRGPMPAEEVVRIGRNVLAALGAAHRREVVHRDVKPSNIFLLEGRAVLTDFGVAKQLRAGGPPLTEPDHVPGTAAYMPPEQLAGAEATPRSDIYALGMVLYEAVTGRPWELVDAPERADWTGVPKAMRPVLSKALAWSPSDRWPDADAFATVLGTAGRRPKMLQVLIGATVLIVAVVAAVGSPWRRAIADMRVEPLDVHDAGDLRALGDSLTQRLARRLKGFPDFSVLGPDDHGRARAAIKGSIAESPAGTRVTLHLGQQAFRIPLVPGRWREAADELVDSLLVLLFRGETLDIDLPSEVLPLAPESFKAFLDAEKQLAAGRWAQADMAYERAIEMDPGCLLCVWRHAEAARWVGMEYDTASQRFLLEHIAQFPPRYRTLIRVDTLPILGRLDSLDALTRQNRDFSLGWFRRADEMMHRASLVGRNERRAAAEPLRITLHLRGDFVPALEHLAWLLVAAGDSAGSAELLDSLEHFPPDHRSSMGIEDLVRIAWFWRMLPSATARGLTQQALMSAQTRGVRNADAGARYLNSFDAPQGAIFLGKLLEPEFGNSARFAQVIGWLELGRVDSANDVLEREQQDAPTPVLGLFQAELRAANLLFPVTGTPPPESAVEGATGALWKLAGNTTFPLPLRMRASWMAGMLSCRLEAGHPGAPSVTMPVVAVTGPLRSLAESCADAASGHPMQALEESQPLTELTAGQVEDPFFRTALHFLRSGWWTNVGEPDRAIRELYWYQNTDQDHLPTLDPQPMEVDWAYGVLARWRWAALGLTAGGSSKDLCRLYGDVARLWAGGEPEYALRADSARRQLNVLKCHEGEP
jgi:hypothetical protein